MKKAVLLFGHADQQSLNAQLAERYCQAFVDAGGSIERFDLAELSFDPVLRLGYRTPQELEPDLLRLRSAIEQCEHLVWVFPCYWASAPTIVRAVFDRLFQPGWAFKYEGGSALPKGLLKGRSSRVILTMDSPVWWYTLVNHRCLHRSFGGASLKLCGLSSVDFSTFYGVHGTKEPKREKWRNQIAALAKKEAAL